MFLLSGCALTALGVRPTEPPLRLSVADPCAAYLSYVEYIQRVKESYATRATANRVSSYLAGGAIAGGVAGSAGLAAGDAPGVGTMALIAIAQGFLATVFREVNNPLLAEIYVNAEGGLDEAIDASLATIDLSHPQTCFRAQVTLRHVVSLSTNQLEIARVNAAQAALQQVLAASQRTNAIVNQFSRGQSVILPAAPVNFVMQPGPSPGEAMLERLEERVRALENKQ